MKESIVLFPISVDELIDKISFEIDKKIKESSVVRRDYEDQYLTRNETAKRLKISLGTLNQWSKDGRLERFRINRRVLYKSLDVEKLVNHSSTSSVL